MAIPLQSKPGVDAPNSDYPYGRPRDNDGSGNGMPVNRFTHGDWHQYFAALLDFGRTIPNGLPDNNYSGFQYMEALLNSVTRRLGETDLTDMNDMILPGVYDIVASGVTNEPSGFIHGQLVVSHPLGGSIIQSLTDVSNGAQWMRTGGDSNTIVSSWILVRDGSKRVDLGPWNMDTVSLLDFNVVTDFQLTAAKIVSYDVFIYGNSGSKYPIDYAPTAAQVSGSPGEAWLPAGHASLTGSTLRVERKDNNFFDDFSSFGGTSVNRGVIIFKIIP